MKSKWNILILNSTLHIGGAEEVISHLGTHLDSGRFNITVCYLKECGMTGQKMIRSGINVIGLARSKFKGTNYFTAPELRKLIQKLKIDLVHTHDLHGFIDASLCRLTLPRLCHVHTFHFGNYPNRKFKYRWIEKMLWRIPHELVAVGRKQKEAIKSSYGIPENRLKVILNGVSRRIPRIAPEIIKAIPSDDLLVIGSISTLIKQKGLTHLLKAIKILATKRQDFLVLVIGEGHLRENLQIQTREMGIESRVRFLGWIKEAAARALPRFDIFVQSSHWEAMSIVVLEAMAQGKPSVVTSVGDNPYIIEHGVTGMLVPPGNAESLANALDHLLDNTEARRRIGSAAREAFEKHYTAAQMSQNYAALFDGVLRQRKLNSRSPKSKLSFIS